MHVFVDPEAAYDFIAKSLFACISILLESAGRILRLSWSPYRQRFVLAEDWREDIDVEPVG